MGSEAQCTIRYRGETAEGKALLETDELITRGAIRLRIPFREMRSVEASHGKLTIGAPNGVAELDLGPAAAKWAEKIRSPRSLLDKLGVRANSGISLVGEFDDGFREQLGGRVGHVLSEVLAPANDLIFFAAESEKDLERLAELRPHLRSDGALWVIHRKGKDTAVSDRVIFAAAKRVGLTATKVARFSDTHTAEKLVIPVRERGE